MIIERFFSHTTIYFYPNLLYKHLSSRFGRRGNPEAGRGHVRAHDQPEPHLPGLPGRPPHLRDCPRQDREVPRPPAHPPHALQPRPEGAALEADRRGQRRGGGGARAGDQPGGHDRGRAAQDRRPAGGDRRHRLKGVRAGDDHGQDEGRVAGRHIRLPGTLSSRTLCKGIFFSL